MAQQAMADITQSKKTQAADKVKVLWLDKLWSVLFDEHSAGLMSPGQIRRERRNRQQVRQMEMQAILEAEADINAIHSGSKALDDAGNLIDTPHIEAVTTHQVIENTAIEQGFDLGLETSTSMIRSAVKEISIRDLERSLNIRKMAILAESEILDAEPRPVSSQPLNAEWVMRWRENAENVFHAEAQVLWARILVQELAQPGRFAPGTLTALRQLSHDDLQVLQVAVKYVLPSFIFVAQNYFDRETHKRWFETLEDLGLMNYQSVNVDLRDYADHQDNLYLPCGNRAIKVAGINQNHALEVPVYKLSRIGKQLFPLFDGEADLAYLFELAKVLKAKGCVIEMGEWQANVSSGAGSFTSKMAL